MIGDVLKRLREESHLSQGAFAKEFGVTQQTIANWESEKREPNVSYIGKIADYFHVSTDYLLGRTDIRDGSIIQAPEELASAGVISVEKSGSAELTEQEIEAIRKMLAGQKQLS